MSLSEKRKELIKDYRTSEDWLEHKGLRNAKELGDCIFLEGFIEDLEKQDKEFIDIIKERGKQLILNEKMCVADFFAMINEEAGGDLI